MQYNPGNTPYEPDDNNNDPFNTDPYRTGSTSTDSTTNTGSTRSTKSDEIDPIKAINRVMDSLGRVVETGANSLGSLLGTAATGATAATAALNALPVDMYETADSVIVKAGPLHGLAPEDLDVTITLDSLTIKGDIKADPLPDGAAWLRQERRVGPFTRTIKVPRAVKNDSAQADFKGGILIITLPKVEEARPKTIRVETV